MHVQQKSKLPLPKTYDFSEKLKTLPDLKFCGMSLNSVESHTVSGTLREERH